MSELPFSDIHLKLKGHTWTIDSRTILMWPWSREGGLERPRGFRDCTGFLATRTWGDWRFQAAVQQPSYVELRQPDKCIFIWVQYIWYLILGWIVWCLGDRLFGPGSQCDAYKTEPSLHIQVFVWHNLMWFVTNFPAVRSSYSSRQCKLLITTCGKNSISDCSNLFHVIVGTQTLTFETI